jgi:hypothetical protein
MKNSSLSGGIGRYIPAVLLLALLGITPARGAHPAKPEEVIDIEKVLDFTGELKITLPSGKIKMLTAGRELFELPSGTLVKVLSGHCTTLLGGQRSELPAGGTARIIKPLVRGSRITGFTGRLKIILPTGEEIILEAGHSLPSLPPGSVIIVLSGEAGIDSQGDHIILTEGETGEIGESLANESLPADIIDLEPVSK